MVLRSFDGVARRLSVHTDLRSAKMVGVARQPLVAMHCYDSHLAVQLRLSATAQVHIDDAVAQAAWATSRVNSRTCYAMVPSPGHAVAAPPAMPRDSDAGRPNFAVMGLTFHSLEWLWLSHVGHRRARFEWGLDGRCLATWLVP